MFVSYEYIYIYMCRHNIQSIYMYMYMYLCIIKYITILNIASNWTELVWFADNDINVLSMNRVEQKLWMRERG